MIGPVFKKGDLLIDIYREDFYKVLKADWERTLMNDDVWGLSWLTIYVFVAPYLAEDNQSVWSPASNFRKVSALELLAAQA